MKFKDAYREKNDAVRVRESLLDEIRAEQLEQVRSERQKKDRKKQWMIAIPTFAAAAVACIAIVVGVRSGNMKNAAPASDNKAADAAYIQQVAEPESAPVLGAPAPNAPTAVASYEELGEVMQARRSKYRGFYGTSTALAEEGVMVDAEMPAEAALEPMPQADSFTLTNGVKFESNGSGKTYSGTNVQVEGVDEADIVKTDGTWIYALNQGNGKVYILAAEGENTKIVCTIDLWKPSENDMFWRDYSEMMLYGDRLYLLGSHYDWSENINDHDSNYTFAEVYDLGDRTDPICYATHKQQGSYRTARLVDGILLIVSDYRISYWYPLDGVKVETYCPKVVTNDTSVTLSPDEIYINPDSEENGFTVVTTIDAAEGDEYDSHKAVLGGCSQVYCSGADLLIASDEWKNEQSDEQTASDGRHFVKSVSGSYTNLFRFTIDGGEINAIASTELPGALLNQFSMDEYNGYYRFVMTRSDSEETIWTDGIDTYEWNSSSDCVLYVLDGWLETVSELDELAKDERVQSVRFMGDTAYFVTFRQVDPLFSVDLSDPSHPTVLGKLKIPGFSAYLHPFGEGKLLGIGYDADEEHGWTENVKLSMFDISDPSDVTEAFKLSLKDVNYTSVQYNHKIVFVDVQSGTVAFPADNVYYVFRVKGDSFEKIGEINVGGEYWFDDGRGLFVDDAFYVIGSQEVAVLSFETMEELARIKLK